MFHTFSKIMKDKGFTYQKLIVPHMENDNSYFAYVRTYERLF